MKKAFASDMFYSKFLIAFSILLFSFSGFQELKKLEVDGWHKTVQEDRVIFKKKESVPLFCCEMDQLNFPTKVQEASYYIIVEKTLKLKRKEIKKRQKLQEAIVRDLGNSSDNPGTVHSNIQHFKIRKNTIDSLRIPLFSRGKYSYFIYDSFEQAGYTNLYVESAKYKHEIKEFRKLIEKTLKGK